MQTNGAGQLDFVANPRELWFYCVHEIHHAGVQRYHDLPYLSQVKTTRDLAALVRYLTFLEGTAVYAARGWRSEAHALSDDADYVALDDSARMAGYEEAYFRIYDELQRTPQRPIADADWAIIDQLSSGDRLWYRVGALMAQRIDEVRGRHTLRSIVIDGPDRFFSTYDTIRGRLPPP